MTLLLYLKKNGYNMYMDGYETSQAFQRDLIHSIWASNDQVMTGVIEGRREERLKVTSWIIFKIMSLL